VSWRELPQPKSISPLSQRNHRPSVFMGAPPLR
jgi:hypothetical protein